jgi:hydroxylaminobenzene mutase
LLIAGTFLFFLGLLNGFVSPFFTAIRVGLSAHLAAVQGGMALLVFGLMLKYIKLHVPGIRLAAWLNIYSMYAAWIALLLSAMWGAEKSEMQKGIIKIFAYTGGVATIVGVAFILTGLLSYKRLQSENANP